MAPAKAERSVEPSLWHQGYLALAFFLAIHDFRASTWNINRSAEFFTATSGSGSPGTKIAFLLLGLYGMHGLFVRARYELRVRGVVSVAVVLLFTWTLFSFLWADQPTGPIGRLAGLAALVLAAVRIRREWAGRAIVRWITLTTTCYAALGLITEFVLGTFQPWGVAYRFSGTLHPNGQGVNCSIAMLGAACLLRQSDRRAFWWSIVVGTGLLDLLTKSRTAVLSLLIAWFIAAACCVGRRNRWILVSVAALLFFLGAWLAQDGLLPSTNALQLGRDASTSDNSSLTGRIPLWSELMLPVEQHLWVGQGFGAFWTAGNIDRISNDQGWGISAAHSAYIDMLLATGIVGLCLYSGTLILAASAARWDYLRNPSAETTFFGIVLVFAMVDGATDSEPIIVSAYLCFCLILALVDVGFRVLPAASPRPVFHGRPLRLLFLRAGS